MNDLAGHVNVVRNLQAGMNKTLHDDNEKLYNQYKSSRKSERNECTSWNVELLSSKFDINVGINKKDAFKSNNEKVICQHSQL